jgi:hypothetical protein
MKKKKKKKNVLMRNNGLIGRNFEVAGSLLCERRLEE